MQRFSSRSISDDVRGLESSKASSWADVAKRVAVALQRERAETIAREHDTVRLGPISAGGNSREASQLNLEKWPRQEFCKEQLINLNFSPAA